MASTPAPNPVLDFLPAENGYINRIAQRFGILEPTSHRCLRVLFLVLVTWVPLVVLSTISGHTSGNTVAITFLRDPEVHCRFLIALPLLELGEMFLAVSLAAQVRQLLNSGIITEQSRDRIEVIRARIRRWHSAVITEATLVAIGVGASLFFRLYLMAAARSSWERQASGITLAGWWHLLISLPILYFFLLRAFWIFVLWTWFLFRVSQLDLQLTPTHPDHAGGLGFLGWGLASFAPITVSFSTVMSAGFAFEIYHRGESLSSLKYHLIAYVILVTLVFHLPVVPFASQLSQCRFRGLLEFSNLAWRHDRAFDEKWIRQPQAKNQDKLLGTSDVQSLANIAVAYDHVEAMGIIPFDYKAMMTIALSAVIPLLPLIGTEIPLGDIISKLGELLI